MVQISFEWSDPFSVIGTETYTLVGPNRMCVDTELTVQGNRITYRTAYNRIDEVLVRGGTGVTLLVSQAYGS